MATLLRVFSFTYCEFYLLSFYKQLILIFVLKVLNYNKKITNLAKKLKNASEAQEMSLEYFTDTKKYIQKGYYPAPREFWN